jgi:hypothetical protein
MEEIYIRDRSSGRIHAVVRRGNRLLSDEADNLDAAGERDEITIDEVQNAEPGDLCAHCFPAHTEET